MLKPPCLALLFVTLGGTLMADAQTNGRETGDDALQRKTPRLLNENHLTSTGETVPHPGESQGAPTTELDRLIEQKDNHLDRSICSNCN
ncbi:MAG TPA: hypothetical protein VLZ74_02665 [Methylocella sp.]|nr:hypothetical protein [Methylocella sp.]